MNVKEVKYSCKYYRGHIPCSPNKKYGVECSNCNYYQAYSKQILIIKLGAIGDVIRTTPLIEKYRALYPDCAITWLTLFPDVLPENEVDQILKWNETSLFLLQQKSFDIAINLDKDEEACALLNVLDAKEKYGFDWQDQHLAAATPHAEHKIITGLFDHISKNNTKSYLEEIFEICHFKFQGEDYNIRLNEHLQEKWRLKIKDLAKGKPIIGLNTGCGPRWKTRLWPDDYWGQLIKDLQGQGFFCMVLGGPAEDEKNVFFENNYGAYYPGHFSLEEFIALSSVCDLIVTQVSLMMHVATAVKSKLVLMNNIFNKHEFELYERGVIVEPPSGCDCYYGTSCSRETRCMYDIEVSTVSEKVNHLLNQK
jgi:heptosyltransferase-2